MNSVEEALDFLASTDEDAAKARALQEYLGESRKSVKADLYLSAEGKSSAEKEQMAYAHETYKAHLEKLKNAIYDYELLRNKRESVRLRIEVWRSKNANRRMGNI